MLYLDRGFCGKAWRRSYLRLSAIETEWAILYGFREAGAARSKRPDFFAAGL